MTLQLHRPDGQGGLKPVDPKAPVPAAVPAQRGRGRGDWRDQLQSPRWRPAPLRNTEMNPTSSLVSALFWAGLAALTFVLLLLGYGTHFWHF